MNVFQKIKAVQELVRDVYPELGVEELTRIVEFLANNWHKNKRKRHIKLSTQQLTIYELLMKNGHNPATVYRWLLLALSPQEIKEKVRNEELSIREALRARRNHRRLVSVDEKQFIEAVIKCVELYISEAGEGYPGKGMII